MIKQTSPDSIVPLKAEVVVKKYRKPEKIGSIWLPEQSLEDRTGSVWEIVRSSEKADEEVGERITVGDICKTRWGAANSLGLEDSEDGRELYLLPVDRIEHRIKNTWSEG